MKKRKTLDSPLEMFFCWALIGIAIAMVAIVAGHYFIKFVVTT